MVIGGGAARLSAVPSGPGESIVLIAAGVVAGTVGAAGGITSLVSYSALLAVGVPPLSANVANLVAGVACWPGRPSPRARSCDGPVTTSHEGCPSPAWGPLPGPCC